MYALAGFGLAPALTSIQLVGTRLVFLLPDQVRGIACAEQDSEVSTIALYVLKPVSDQSERICHVVMLGRGDALWVPI